MEHVRADAGDPDALRARLAELVWYHAIDVAPGVTTDGWFDLRHALDLLPFPDVRGKRCLDVGTWDGFYAFELERRGAAEVVAIDVPDLSGIDHPPDALADPTFDPAAPPAQHRNAGFRLLHEVLGSRVRLVPMSVYDLGTADLGTFDLVVVGSLLVHLRDPVRALDAVRRVTAGHLLSVDYVHPPLSLLSRRRPLFELRGEGRDFQWWLANDAGLRHLLHVAGFTVERTSPHFLLRPGPSDAGRRARPSPREQLRRGVAAALARDTATGGHLHRAHLARPRF